jgi:chromosome partitioning protein
VSALALVREARGIRSGGLPRALMIPSKVDRRTSAGREIEAALHEFGEPVGPAVGLRSAFADAATARTWVGELAPRSTGHQEIAACARVVARLTTSGRISGNGEAPAQG